MTKKIKRSFMRITIERIDVSENGFEYPTIIKVIDTPNVEVSL